MLLITNAATSAVMRAKINSPVPKIDTISPTWSLVSSPSCSPVMTSVRSGSTSAIAACTVSMSAPSASLMSIVSTVFSVSSQVAAETGSQTTVVAPTNPSELPSPTSPTIVKFCWPLVSTTRIVSPTS